MSGHRFGWAAFIVALVLAVACRGGEEATPVSVVDASGAEVTFEAPPQRIISFSPGATEILFAIGAGERIVAADEFSDFPAETEALGKVSYLSPEPEAALTFEPDLVIFASAQEQHVERFRSLGLRVLYNPEPESVEGVLENIALLGRVAGAEEAAEALVAQMRARIDAVTERIADVVAGPRVFYELDDTLFTVGPDTFIGSMLTLLKAQNVAEGAATPFPQLSAEALVAADPEVVLLADAAFGATPEVVAARPGWSSITAVREGRLVPIDPDIGSRPGPRIVDAIELMAQALYPDRFE